MKEVITFSASNSFSFFQYEMDLKALVRKRREVSQYDWLI